ncbi:MAG: exodeoxyribonuclease VII large subunit [Deltaproteobacteria bacterium]|nr:exodeoxyribonuclease VII large subunit [Deltaproteobacteria bacterium]
MADTTNILTVSRLNELLKEVVEENFWEVWVEGEVSNFSAPSSGHYYFVLKDEKAAVRGVMFRPYNRLLPFVPEDGMKVLCRGRVSLYPQRGELQVLVEAMEVCGLGNLHLAFRQLKERLAAEGLFAEERKRPLPGLPRVVGVVTSGTGAAIRDILKVLSRRGAGIRILLAPVKVQGEGAAAEIAAAVTDFNRHGMADVLIVGRGGGSLEDLWAFNEELVARAIFSSRIPVISAVGHETDVTIADLAADLRAPTPSAAAELVVKSRLELESHLDHLEARLLSRVAVRFRLLGERLQNLEKRLCSPVQKLELQRRRCREAAFRLQAAMRRGLEVRAARLAAFAGRLEALSPLDILARGFAVVAREKDGVLVRRAGQLTVGERLRIRFQEGTARVITEEIVNP